MYISVVLKACCPSRINLRRTLAIYTCLVLKRVARVRNRKHILVYLVLKRVFRVEKTEMYYLHCSTCNPSGMEGNIHFAPVVKSCCTSGVETGVESNILYIDVTCCMCGNTPSGPGCSKPD